MSEPSTARGSTADVVFERLLADVVAGRHEVGSWLPTERELAESFGVSRPTVREAVQRLASMQLVLLKKGHRVRVRDAREWRFGVLPAYLQAGAPLSGGVGRLIRDLLFLRRKLVVMLVEMVADYITEEALDEAREVVLTAWRSRAEPAVFLERDLDVLRTLSYRCHAFPGLWLTNSVFGVYLELARKFTAAFSAPSEYTTIYMSVLDALGDGEGSRAAGILSTYLKRHDDALLASFGLPATPE